MKRNIDGCFTLECINETLVDTAWVCYWYPGVQSNDLHVVHGIQGVDNICEPAR